MLKNIWLPESVYRCFPFAILLVGMLSCATAPHPLSVVLGIGLMAYGIRVLAARAGYR